MSSRTVRYRTTLYCIVLCNIVLHNLFPFSAMLHHVLPCFDTSHYAISHVECDQAVRTPGMQHVKACSFQAGCQRWHPLFHRKLQ